MVSVIIIAFTSLLVLPFAACLYKISVKRPSSHQVRVWRRMLEVFIISFTDLQLVTGFALLVSSTVNIQHSPLQKYDPIDFQDARFVLILYECCLLNSSYLATLIPLKEYLRQQKKNYFRQVFYVLFSIFLVVYVGMSYHAFEPVSWLLEGKPAADDTAHLQDSFTTGRRVVSAFLLLYIFWIGFIQVLEDLREQINTVISRFQSVNYCNNFLGWTIEHLVKLLLISNPVLAFLVQIISVAIFTSFVLLQKFTPSPGITENARILGIREWCSLSGQGDDEWDFGQTLAIVLLLQPFLSLSGTYIGKVNVA